MSTAATAACQGAHTGRPDERCAGPDLGSPAVHVHSWSANGRAEPRAPAGLPSTGAGQGMLR